MCRLFFLNSSRIDFIKQPDSANFYHDANKLNRPQELAASAAAEETKTSTTSGKIENFSRLL